MVSLGQLKSNRSRLIALVLLLFLVILGAIPGYLAGQWQWQDLPEVETLSQLKVVREEGIELAEWQTLEAKPLQIRGQDWVEQTVERDGQRAILLLRPQKWYKDRPQVEWMDLNGFQQWRTDSSRRVPLDIPASDAIPQPPKVKTRYMRAWTQTINPLANILWSSCSNPELCSFYQRQRLKQTYAVMEWYAWPTGGSPSPSRWFIADRLALLSQSRAAWVASCILIPIEPLGNIDKVESIAQSLGTEVHVALMNQAFNLGDSSQ
ncbi:MAG: cyanoexosortase B system-associated protein [Microcoleaceae cyanobacterium]